MLKVEIYARSDAGVNIKVRFEAYDKKKLAVMLRLCDPSLHVYNGRYYSDINPHYYGNIRAKDGRITAMVNNVGCVHLVNHPSYRSCLTNKYKKDIPDTVATTTKIKP